MGASPVLARGGLVDRRPHQRMAYRDDRARPRPAAPTPLRSPARPRPDRGTLAARLSTAISPVSSAAASSSTACTSAESLRLRSRKTRSTRAVRCSWAGKWRLSHELGGGELGRQLQQGQRVAAGLGEESTGDVLGGCVIEVPARAGRGQRPDPARSAPARGGPAPGTASAASSRVANSITTRSAPILLAQNSSAPALAGSSQCASSMTHSTRFSSAAAVSTVKVATPTRNGSTDGPSSSPNATRNARAWGAGSSSRSRITGRSSRCRAANANGASASSPWVRSTVASVGGVHAARRAGRTCPRLARRAPPRCRPIRAAPPRRARQAAPAPAHGRPARVERTARHDLRRGPNPGALTGARRRADRRA